MVAVTIADWTDIVQTVFVFIVLAGGAWWALTRFRFPRQTGPRLTVEMVQAYAHHRGTAFRLRIINNTNHPIFCHGVAATVHTMRAIEDDAAHPNMDDRGLIRFPTPNEVNNIRRVHGAAAASWPELSGIVIHPIDWIDIRFTANEIMAGEPLLVRVILERTEWKIGLLGPYLVSPYLNDAQAFDVRPDDWRTAPPATADEPPA